MDFFPIIKVELRPFHGKLEVKWQYNAAGSFGDFLNLSLEAHLISRNESLTDDTNNLQNTTHDIEAGLERRIQLRNGRGRRQAWQVRQTQGRQLRYLKINVKSRQSGYVQIQIEIGIQFKIHIGNNHTWQLWNIDALRHKVYVWPDDIDPRLDVRNINHNVR